MASKLGNYLVNGIPFTSKVQAFVYANPTKLDVSWWFYDQQWKNANWSIEPEISLSFLYKQRAQQIRDEYDYIAVMYSGGADSTNVVYSFLNNNIHIDEVIAGAPISGIKNLKLHTNTTHPSNMISETEYAQLPGLKEIHQKDSRIKITIHDYFEDMVNLKSQEWLYGLSHWLNPSVVRHRLEKFDHLKKLAEEGKKVAILYGIDKPSVTRSKTGNLYCVIPDNSINFLGPHFDREYNNVDTVLFYFAPDYPILLVKEVWEIIKFFYRPGNEDIRNKWFWHFDRQEKDPHLRASMYQRLIVPTIYPDISNVMKNKFQAAKSSLGFMGNSEIDSWVYQLHNKERFMDMWNVDSNGLLKFLDKKYLNPVTGFKTFIKGWKICHESQLILK